MATKVLVVDDEKIIVKGLTFSLTQDGMEVSSAYDGLTALDMAKENNFDIILLDLMLPGLDGLSVCQEIRTFSDVPIIMLTAKGEDMDKILGLEYGADDYITKPYNILELKARMKAILRRNNKQQVKQVNNTLIEYEYFKLDLESRSLFLNEIEINLTAREFNLVELMAKHPNKVYTREALLKEAWGTKFPGDARTVDVHIRRLREKIEKHPGSVQFIHTKWGVGYYFHV